MKAQIGSCGWSFNRQGEWEMNQMDIETIHESLVNGQRKQMVNQIQEYGLYDFWSDYETYLMHIGDEQDAFDYFTDATISYFRITRP